MVKRDPSGRRKSAGRRFFRWGRLFPINAGLRNDSRATAHAGDDAPEPTTSVSPSVSPFRIIDPVTIKSYCPMVIGLLPLSVRTLLSLRVRKKVGVKDARVERTGVVAQFDQQLQPSVPPDRPVPKRMIASAMRPRGVGSIMCKSRSSPRKMTVPGTAISRRPVTRKRFDDNHAGADRRT